LKEQTDPRVKWALMVRHHFKDQKVPEFLEKWAPTVQVHGLSQTEQLLLGKRVKLLLLICLEWKHFLIWEK
jgi:hypothetical protein